MSDSHIRIKISSNYTALQQLTCSAYKILLCLASHADSLGRCFPTNPTIQKECDLHKETVYSGLQQLIELGYVKYLRRWFLDPFTGLQMPAVYQVSPYFLEIAESNLEAAYLLWATNNTEKPTINQQQELVPKTNAINQHQNQQQQPTTAAPEKQPQTAKSEKQKQQRELQPERQQRSLTNKSSAIVKKYTNPLSIIEPLPDGLSEILATRVNTFKIPLPMARGFVFKYGYAEVEKAANYVEFCSKMQTIVSLSGFFRMALESKVYDQQLIEIETQDYTGGDLKNFVES